MRPSNDAFLCSARWWKSCGQGIQCLLCPRHCILNDGERGFCFVRQNIQGTLKTLYGVTSGLAVDPIEKKPLFHFLPGSQILSFGTIGCNLGCSFCQNWRISNPCDNSQIACYAQPQEICAAAKKEKCSSVAFTYNEPIISAEYVIDVAQECQKKGIKTVAVTAGYICAGAREEFFRSMDAANVDLKGFSSEFYQKFCAAALEPILETLVYIKQKTRTWLELTNLLLPGQNDSLSEIEAMCRWIVRHLGVDVPLHFSAFHPDHKFLDSEPTPEDVLLKARDVALRCGMHYVYTGNIADIESTKTFCYHCGKVLIERKGHAVGKVNIKNGCCVFCQTRCQGYFT